MISRLPSSHRANPKNGWSLTMIRTQRNAVNRTLCPASMTDSLARDGEGLGAMWGEQKALEFLAEARFIDVAVEQVEGAPINNFYIARKHKVLVSSLRLEPPSLNNGQISATPHPEYLNGVATPCRPFAPKPSPFGDPRSVGNAATKVEPAVSETPPGQTTS